MNTTRSSYWEAKTSEEKILAGMILDVLSSRGISGWSVIFSRESNRLGYCDYSKREICVSRKVVLTDWAEAVDTAMHEVAHAVAGAGSGHGPRWKAVAVDLGAKPQEKADYVNRHQTGETKTVKTSYGPVKITVGNVYNVQGSIGKLRIIEVQRKSFVGESALGSLHSLPVDFLHPNYGDASKVAEKIVTVRDYKGDPIQVTLGKSTYLKNNVPYVAVEGRRRNVLTVSPQGDRLLVPAELFRKQK